MRLRRPGDVGECGLWGGYVFCAASGEAWFEIEADTDCVGFAVSVNYKPNYDALPNQRPSLVNLDLGTSVCSALTNIIIVPRGFFAKKKFIFSRNTKAFVFSA